MNEEAGKILWYKINVVERSYNLWEISKFPAATTFGICNAFSKSNVNVEVTIAICEVISIKLGSMHYL